MCNMSPLVAEFPGYPFRAAYNSVQYPNVFSKCCSIGILPCRMKFHVGFQGHRTVNGVRHKWISYKILSSIPPHVVKCRGIILLTELSSVRYPKNISTEYN